MEPIYPFIILVLYCLILFRVKNPVRISIGLETRVAIRFGPRINHKLSYLGCTSFVGVYLSISQINNIKFKCSHTYTVLPWS